MFTSAAEAGLVEAFTAGLKACSTHSMDTATSWLKLLAIFASVGNSGN